MTTVVRLVAALIVTACIAIGFASVAAAEPAPEVPVASAIENDRAQQHFNTNLGTAMQIGGIAGTATGAAIGCAIGLIGAIVGCIPGAITGAAIGGVVGTLAFGGPTLVYSAIDVVQTWQAPPGTTKWADPQ